MTAHLHQPAVFESGTAKQIGDSGPVQTGMRRQAIVEVGGVEFRSWLPQSAEECSRINTEAEEIVRRANIPGI